MTSSTGQQAVAAAPNPDPVQQMNTYRSFVSLLIDPTAREESKLKAVQELAEDLETITSSPQYPQFLEHAIKIFMKVLTEGEPVFVAEFNGQQLRKLILEIIHRLPANDHLKPHSKNLISLMFHLVSVENEENVLICLRIIIELHKLFRPPFSLEIQKFLQAVKKIYQELPNNVQQIFEPQQSYKKTHINEIDIKQFLNNVFTQTTIGEQATAHTVLPRAVLSLRVLSELPISVVLMYQLYKANVCQEVESFIAPIMTTITLQPLPEHRASPLFNKEVYVDFMAAQIKTLSFLAFIVRYCQDTINQHSQQLICGLISLLQNCPQEVAHLRKELLIAARHILATDLRVKFASCIDKLFDERILIGNGWTVCESLRPLAYSTIADLVHHIRHQLSLRDLAAAVNVFSKNVHDESLPTTIQTMSCKLLLNLVECIRAKTESDPQLSRDLLMRMLEVFVLKFKSVAQLQLPILMHKHAAAQGVPNHHPLRYPLNEKLDKLLDPNKSPTAPSAGNNQALNTTNCSGQAASPSPPMNGSNTSGSGNGSPSSASASGASENLMRSSVSFPNTSGDMLGKEERTKFGFPPSPSLNYTIADCRSLVKTLVCGVKTITFTVPSYKPLPFEQQLPPNTRVFHPKETIVFMRLVKYAMLALDIYQLSPNMTTTTPGINLTPAGNSPQSTNPPLNTMQPNLNLSNSGPGVANRAPTMLQTMKSKEEKEVLEYFATIFQTLSPQIFQEIFSIKIEYIVERIHYNNALQIVANSFLANPQTSPIFATILVEFLLDRIEEMGCNVDKSNLYLRLFKLVFGSVSLFAHENEQMLKPHLHNIVNRSMRFALSAKDPYNYFLLLRALFRSIGGGSHDLLYQEFLPLLPSLLQGLNSLQSGLHKQHMKDLFVELCLTVPVRLSSLLPYLPMLMDPLVSALNGTQTLVSQGLRTLELCVDNLQPDFLYDHIQPVRAELMQALWRTLRNPQDSIAQVSFRVLGKFGGGNRKMMTEPQRLQYVPYKEAQATNNVSSSGNGCSITIQFNETKSTIQLQLDCIVESAFNALKSSSTEPYYRKQCWEVIKGFLIAHIQQPLSENTGQVASPNAPNLTPTTQPDPFANLSLAQFFVHTSFSNPDFNPSGTSFPMTSLAGQLLYKCRDPELRKTHEMALTGMFLAAAIKELRQNVLPFMVTVVRHYTLVAIAQQAGPVALNTKQSKLYGMDPLVIIDAVAAIMGHEEKELCKPGHLALIIILDTATSVLRSREHACQLPLTEYLVERMCALCYERAWYAKIGGCIAIKSLFERMTLRWVFAHQYVFLKALLFVMMDLSGEVSNGAIDMAKSNLEKLLLKCANPLDPGEAPEVFEAQRKSLNEVTVELIRHVTSSNTLVREQVISSLKTLAVAQSATLAEIIQPHKDVLADMVPPKKHILRHQPVNAQIGLMDGNTFCMSIEPRLFTIDASINEHRVFFNDVLNLCNEEDTALLKHPCYKNVSKLTPLRKSALHALSSCYHLDMQKDKIFAVLFKALNSPNAEIQQTGFECMQRFTTNTKVEVDTVHQYIRPLLMVLADFRGLNLNVMQRLSYMTQLFPNIFNEKLCDSMYAHAKKWLDAIIIQMRQGQKFHEEMRILAAIIDLFHQVSAASAKFVEHLLCLVFKAEKVVMMEPGSLLRDPLRKFLKRYPEHTLELLLTERNINEDQIYRFVKYLLSGKEGLVFRQILMNNPERLIRMASGSIQIQEKVSVPQPATPQAMDGSQTPGTSQTPGQASSAQPPTTKTVTVTYDLQFQCILITSILVKHDLGWIGTQPVLVEKLKRIWISEEFSIKHSRINLIDYVQWKEPKLLVKCLLQYFKLDNSEIELLFELLRAFMQRFVCDFDFLRQYLEQEICEYSPEWKRLAFKKFVFIFPNNDYTQELKAKILQYIVIPSFASAFEQGQAEQLIGGPPAPEQEPENNLISMFITDVIDPERPFGMSDAVRILLLQLSCLLVEQASSHIHDAANKRQGNKLRRLMTYAWPCLLAKNCVDPATRYHGHLLLSHIIAKFAIHKRIVLQVFHSLLKAYAIEARGVVRQALEILTPAMPQRMEDGNTMLTHWTKKIIVEEGHVLTQLVHMLQLLIRHYKVYYPVRHHLIQHMVNSVQKLGFTPNASVEHKKIAVDLAEVIIRWEVQRIKEQGHSQPQPDEETSNNDFAGIGDISEDDSRIKEEKPIRDGTSSLVHLNKQQSVDNRPVEKQHADAIVNFLLRLACQVNEAGSNVATPGELLSRRCVTLLKTALKPEIWPNAELKLVSFDKLLLTVEYANPPPNFGNICTALDLFSFLLSILRKEQILSSFRPLQKGIVACLNCCNNKVIKCVHNLLARLMEKFPLEATQPLNTTTGNASNSAQTTPMPACKHEELEALYAAVAKIIQEGLTSYEKMQGIPIPLQNLFSTLMILKAVCIHNTCYIDRLMTSFMRVLHKMAKDHLSGMYNGQPMLTPGNPNAGPPNASGAPINGNQMEHMATELLIYALDLVKNRIGVMGQEMRKTFFSSILIGLIEKSPDVKVLKAITKMVEDWVKNRGPFGPTQAPNTKEKTLLLVKMMHFIEKRFPDDVELNAQFLELINHVYRDDKLKSSDLTAKLEQAFMAGLRFNQPHIRNRFFEIFDLSIRRRLADRLLYIVCSQNWENIGAHFWIKQAIELLLTTANPQSNLIASNRNTVLPSPTSVFEFAEPSERQTFIAYLNEEPMDLDVQLPANLISGTGSVGSGSVSLSKEHEDDLDIEASSMDGSNSSLGIHHGGQINNRQLQLMLQKQSKFFEGIRETKCIQFLQAVAQLAHMDTTLAAQLWVQLFPSVWAILTANQRTTLQAEVVPFLCSGSHVLQKDCQPSVIGTFMEAIAHCQPPIPIRPCLLKYIGSAHNLWHRSVLMLEDAIFYGPDAVYSNSNTQKTVASTTYPSNKRNIDEISTDQPQHPVAVGYSSEAMDALSQLYETLREDDLFAGLWEKRANYKETLLGVSYEQQGLFEQAQASYELAISQARNDYNSANPAPHSMESEYLLLEQRWVRCCKELNQWDTLLEFASTKSSANPFLVLESAWRVPNWSLMRQAIAQVESNCPKEYAWKVALYKGFNHICNQDEHNLAIIERMVDLASSLCIKEWRRLPSVVSNVHLPLLQAAQQIMELQEAGQIHSGLLPLNLGRSSSLHDMKAIVKTWRNRLPVLADDLSHWSDIFTWRQHHYQAIVANYDVSQLLVRDIGSSDSATVGSESGVISNPQTQASHAMLGVHASAQSIIHYGKLARKQQLISVCLDSLNRIHTIPSVPIVDCFQKIRQQVKCYLQLSNTSGPAQLQEGLEVIESTNLKYFTKEMTAEFFALKGLFLSQLNRSDDANRAFSAGAQLHDTLVKAWALWGDYLQSLFENSSWSNRQINLAVSALTCYLHACRHQNEPKSRKYLAKVLYLLSYDDSQLQLAEAVEKYNVGVPPLSWLPWIPQLLTCLLRNEGKLIVNILSQVGRVYPQAVYFPLRTMYLTLKMEQREKYKNASALSQSQLPLPVLTTDPIKSSTDQSSGNESSGTAPTTAAESSNTNNETETTNTPGNAGTAPTFTQTPPNNPAPTQAPSATENQIKATPPMWRCSKILHTQRDLHPTVLSSLEGIVDQMAWFRENWYEEVLRQLRLGLAKCYSIAFEHRAKTIEAPVTNSLLNFVRKLVATFGVGIEHNLQPIAAASCQLNSTSESLARRAQATAQDPVFQRMKQQFTNDFDFEQLGAMRLHNLIPKLAKWIKILEAKIKLLPKSLLIEEKCRFLGNFSQQIADIELPGEFLLPKHNHYYVRIARFMPRVEVVQKHNSAARRLHIRGHNGKLYPYLIVSDTSLTESRNEERILQLMRLLNHLLGKQKETARRFLQFTVPKVVAISPQMRLVQDNCDSISLLDIYRQHCGQYGLDVERPINRYYERLAAIQSKTGGGGILGLANAAQAMHEILNEVQSSSVASADLLRTWARRTFPSATDYCAFRKQFTLQMSLACLAEHVLHLTRLNAEQLYVHQDSGFLNVAYYRFDLDERTGEFAAARPIPFRLTHNIAQLITPIGVDGSLTASMIATARCLVQPNFKLPALLRALLRDELLYWYKRTQEKNTNTSGEITMEGELLVNMVNASVNAISTRLQNLAMFDDAESKVNALVAAAGNVDNLSRMDPAWHPWL